MASAASRCTAASARGKPRLTYLDFPGIAEPIRLALFVGGVDFEDRRVSYAEVADMRNRGELPFGQVPLLEVDGAVYSQSGALLRWAGKAAGLYPEECQMRCDQVEEALADIKRMLMPQWYGSVLGRHPEHGTPTVLLSEAQKVEVQRTLNNEVLPPRFAMLEAFLKRRPVPPYFCGEQLTVCDLSLYVMVSGLRDGSYIDGISASEVLGACPELLALADRVAEHDKVQEWNELRRAAAGPKAHAA